MITPFMPTLPYEAVISFTYRCNLGCPFCYQQPERSRRRAELSAEQWLSFIDELSALQLFSVTVSGGEPFSHELCTRLLTRIAAGRMRFKLLTNGTLIGAAEAELLAGLKRCAQIQLSLDGFEAEHDAIRGPGTFQKTLRALQILTDAGLNVVTNTVVTRQNYRNMVDWARFLETLPLAHYRLTPYNECCGDDQLSGAMLSPEELAELIAALDRHAAELPHVFKRNLPFTLLADIRAPRRSENEFALCMNTFRAFGVHPDGAVVPCPDAPGPIMGYIGATPFAEIWNNERYQHFRAQAIAGERRDAPECRDCPYTYQCRKFCIIAHNRLYCRKKIAVLLRQRGVEC